MAILYDNFTGGLISDNPLAAGATTINSAGLANLATVASPNVEWLVLDPDGSGNGPEIVKVTAHTSAATSATIVRGQQGTSDVQHAQNTEWSHAATAADFDALPTSVLTTKGDLVVATGANAVDRQGVGSNNELLVADSAQANGIKWSQAQTANIADDAVTTAKIADKAVTGPKMQSAVCQLLRTTVSIGDATPTTISFNSVTHELLDPLDWHDPASNSSRVTPDIAGWYRVSGCASFATATTYTRVLALPLRNGFGITASRSDMAWTGPTESFAPGPQFTSRLTEMNGTTDYFEIQVLQNSNASKDADVSLHVELVYPT